MNRVHLANCRRPGVDPDVMHPDNTAAAIADAKAVCRDCPIAADCLRIALHIREPHGVWGGLTAAERARVLAGHPTMYCRHCADPYVPINTGQRRCTICSARRHQQARPRPRPVDPCRADITRWAGLGMRDRDIAARLGVSKHAVQRARMAWGVRAGEAVRISRGVDPGIVTEVESGRAPWEVLSDNERVQLWLRHEASGGDQRSFQARYGVGTRVAEIVRRAARRRHLIAA